MASKLDGGAALDPRIPGTRPGRSAPVEIEAAFADRILYRDLRGIDP